MRRLVILGALLAFGGCWVGKDLPIAREAREKFHRLYDAGKCSEIYRAASKDLKGSTTEQAWNSLCQGLMGHRGKLKQAKSTGFFDRYDNGEHFVELTFRSQFDRGAGEEKFIFRMQDGRALLAGYHYAPEGGSIAPTGSPTI